LSLTLPLLFADSPYSVAVQDDPLVDVRGGGVESAPVGQVTELTIDASRALFRANPTVFITGIILPTWHSGRVCDH